MIKAEKIVRDLLNDHAKHFDIYQGEDNTTFTLKFSIPHISINHINMAALKLVADALNVHEVRAERFDRGFRISLQGVDANMRVDVATVEGIRAKQDMSAGPVWCKTCNDTFTTLEIALKHAELVHRGDVELDSSFSKVGDAKTTT